MKWYNDLKIGKKLTVGFSSIVIIFVGVIAYEMLSMNDPGKLQDAGAKRAEDSAVLMEIKVPQTQELMLGVINPRGGGVPVVDIGRL